MHNNLFLVLIYLLGLVLITNSCQKNENKKLQSFITPYIKKTDKHLLIVPQIYCRNCIRTLFEKAEKNKLNNNVQILFLEVNMHNDAEIPSKIHVAKYNDFYNITHDKNADLLWVELDNGVIQRQQKLTSAQFYEQLPKWTR